MKRYRLTEEVHKDGRKKLIQYCVYDNFEDRVIVRYATKKEAQDLIDRYETLVGGSDETS